MAETKSILKSAGKDVSVVVEKRCSYFATSGLIVLEKGLNEVPSETADYLIGKGYARKQDVLAKK